MRRLVLALLALLAPVMAGCQTLTVDGWVWCDAWDGQAPVGTWVEVSSTYLDQAGFRDRWAVVGESGPNLHVEFSRTLVGADGEERPSPVFGLTVDRESGRVLRAVFARPGEEPEEALVRSEEPRPEKPAPKSTAEETLEVPAGSYRVRRETFAGVEDDVIKWTGLEGLVEGVDVKVAEGDASASLVEIEEQALTIGETELAAIHCRYDNGRENWLAVDPIPFVGRHVRVAAGSISTEVSALGDDAKPVLPWRVSLSR